MAGIPLTEASLAQLQEAMQSGVTSSVELVVLHLNRILVYDRRGPTLNAVPVLNPRVLEEAARADALRRLGIELSALHGIPFVVKDSYNVAGLPTSVGLAAWKALRAPSDAFVVAQMRQAGAVLIGKANLDTFASNSEGVSEAFGAVRNPYGAKAVGGSSAGSAVAVAAHLSPIAFGGDTAGSLRMPASRNNVVALRPTLGLISTAGTAPGDPLFDVVGPMTRTVADLVPVLNVIVAADAHNPLSAYLPPRSQQRPDSYLLKNPPVSLRKVTLAVPRRLIGEKSEGARVLTPGVPILSAFRSIRHRLERAGATVIEVDVPADAVLDDTWYYDQDVSQAGEAARPIYAARVALVNIRAFAGEFVRFCSGWCGDPADRLLDVAAIFDYPEFMQAFEVLRKGTALELGSAPVGNVLRSASDLAEGPLFKQWMVKQGIDALLFPASSDADSDTRFGFNYMSELGAPGLFIPGGYVEGQASGTVQPLGIALVAPRWAEQRLLEIGAAVEAALHARVNPASAPPLQDELLVRGTQTTVPKQRADKTPPSIELRAVQPSSNPSALEVLGTAADASGVVTLHVYINGIQTEVERDGTRWAARLRAATPGDALCVESGAVIVLAKDVAGNTSAVMRPLPAMPDCAGAR